MLYYFLVHSHSWSPVGKWASIHIPRELAQILPDYQKTGDDPFLRSPPPLISCGVLAVCCIRLDHSEQTACFLHWSPEGRIWK